MKRFLMYAAILCLLALPSFSFACSSITLSASYHFDRTNEHNERNYRLGCEYDYSDNTTIKVGFYRNSYYRDTLFQGTSYQPWHWNNWKFGGSASLVTGYTQGRIEVIAMGTATYDKDWWGLNFHLVPGSVAAIELKYNLK